MSGPASRLPLSIGRATVRLATPADNAGLCQVFASVPMESEVRVAFERDPDFFALYALQEVDALTFVAELEGRIEGAGTLLGRDGWLDGVKARVGYAGDLRAAPATRGGFVLGQAFPACFQEGLARFGCEVMTTAILEANAVAVRALVKRSPRHPDKPFYRPWRRFSIVSLPFLRRRRPRPTALTVRPGREQDLGAIADLLQRDHARRPFGYVFDEGVLRGRLARWPGLRPESFVLALRGERLVGVTAVWDPDPVKRMRVLGYRGALRWVRHGLSLLARLLGASPLPPPGQVLRTCYLTHTSVEDEDPAVMAALLDFVYAERSGQGYHLLEACLFEQDPLAPAFQRYFTARVPAWLYTVSAPGSPWNERDPGPGRPGFEMALV